MKKRLFIQLVSCSLILLASAIGATAQIPPPTPEILYYRFDGTGTTVPNLALTPPPGTATANILGSITQGGTGQCSTALVGSGVSSTTDYLNTNWAPNLGNSSWSISFWTSNITPSSTLFYIFGDAGTASFRCFTNGVAGANNWILRGAGMTDVLVSGGATVAPHMTTFVYDNSVNQTRGYLDGVLVTTINQGAVNLTGTGPLKVMGYSANVGAPAGGLLDEYRLYNRAITAAEVLALYQRNTYATLNVNACGSSYTSPSGNNTWTTGGAYTDVLTGANMYCGDSILTINLTLTPPLAATATISAAPGNDICSGTSVTMTANVTNAGTTPSYQWYVNGMPVGTDQNTYSSSLFNNSDAVNVVVTSSYACPAQPTVTSNTITMTVNPIVTPTISIAVSPSSTVCAGTTVTYTATTTFGGTTPAYQWLKNGIVQSAITNVFVDNAPADGDVVNCILTSNEPCVSVATAGSNSITMTVTPNVTPDATIAVTPSASVCQGTAVTYTATTVNEGTTPGYQWFKNNVLLPATGLTYADNAPVNGDVVEFVLTNNDACVTAATDTSNSVTMVVDSTNTLAGAAGTTETLVVNISGPTQVIYTDCDVIATITPSGVSPINGNTAVGVTIDNAVNNYQGQPYVQRHYDIEPGNSVPAPTATITLYALQSEFDAYNVAATPGNYPMLPTGGVDNGNVKITQYHGTGTAPGNYTGSPELIIPTVSWDAVNNWWELTFDVTDFSGFYIHTGSMDYPLAITLKSIKATNVGAVNRIDWATASEDKGDIFILERSGDGKTFNTIATIVAKGSPSVYAYNDERPLEGVNYYRIKVADVANKSTYSNIVTARTNAGNVFTLQAYPNPAHDMLTVTLNGNHSDKGTLTITDMMGRVVKQMPFSGDHMSIDIKELAAGNYMIRYTDDVNTTTIKIGKQ